MTDYRDPQLRELTFKLMQMAPQAPPFQEIPMTTLKPQQSESARRNAPQRRTRTALAFVAAALGLVLIVAMPIMLLRGDGAEPPVNPTTTSAATTSVPPPALTSQEVSLYFLADYVADSNVPGPNLIPMTRAVEFQSIATSDSEALGAAMEALIDGPNAGDTRLISGVSSSIPAGTELLGFTLDNSSDVGRATLDFNPAFEAGGGSFAMSSRLAQVVFTATQFPDVDEVVIAINGVPADVFSSEGIVLDGPQTRADYSDTLPLIFVEGPLPGTKVESPIDIHGMANTFEAGLQYQVLTQDGRLLVDGFTTATCGTGCWGDFEVTIDYALQADTPGYVVVFESSAEDGRPVNVVRIPVTLAAVEGSPAGYFTEVSAVIPGGAPLDGAVVVQSPLQINGFTDVSGTITVNGSELAVVDGGFTTTVDLEAGVNEILVADGVQDTIYTVTYVPNGTVEFSYLTQVGSDEVVADYAQWMTGEEANQAAIEDGVIAEGETVDNDYYIRNQNPQLRTLPLADNAAINLPSPAFGSVLNVTVGIDEWLALFAPDGTPWDIEGGEQRPEPPEPHFGYFGAGDSYMGYWLTLDADGTVVQITGQYRP